MTTSTLFVAENSGDGPTRLVRPAVFWGSDCVRCGNTTPESMRCDDCNKDDATVALFYDVSQYKYAEAISEKAQ